MALVESFQLPEENSLTEEFLEQGYVVRGVENIEALDEIRHQVVVLACDHLGCEMPDDEGEFLNHIYKVVNIEKLNDLRMAIYGAINTHSWLRPTYYSLARNVIDALVGNELAMQNKINLSIQLPDDDSSLLGIHSDSFSGETPFQVVEWVPLIDVYDTKAMFLLPPEANRKYIPRFKAILEKGGMDLLWTEVKDDLVWIEVPYGKVLIFSPNLLHGNIVNTTGETRWSFNCRVTGLFTPYASTAKSLGGFYLPITTKVVSRVGMNYQAPEGLDG